MFYDKESDFEDDLVAVLKRHGWTDGVLATTQPNRICSSNWTKASCTDNNNDIDQAWQMDTA